MSQQNTLRSLEITFGKIPPLIRENIKYLSYDDTSDYFNCEVCDKIIKKASCAENTTLNFEKHILTKRHQSYVTTTDELQTSLTSTFHGDVPHIVVMNVNKLGINGKDYECVLCDKIIQVNDRDISVTTNNFSYHLLSQGHERKLEDYSETLSQLYEVYGGVPRIILNHSDFLIKEYKHYLCTLCDKQLQIHPTDVNETEKCFLKHLHSLKHLKNAKQAKAFSITPELRKIFSGLPNYMLRNFEYISINGLNFFCSLCNENIKFNNISTYETQLNFKQHFFSSTHEEKLLKRKNPEDDVFNRICNIFEDLPEVFQNNLMYLTVNDDDLYCELCEETLTDDGESTKEMLEWHFQSDHHEYLLNSKSLQCTETLEDLDDVFGTIPQIIQDNIKHIKYRGGKRFECVLCNKMMQAKFDGDYEDNTYITRLNFEQHLESNGHKDELEKIEMIENDLEETLEEIFCVIPQFIMNNFDHLSFAGDNLECILCAKQIAIAPGNKKTEVTEQNFRNHFLSVGHIAKLKNNANNLMEALDVLQFIFGKVPDFVESNIQHIQIEEDHYLCTLCDARIMKGGADTTSLKFREHLFGANHRSESDAFERENDEAFSRIDQSYWRIPEFLLRNIDFLDTIDDDLYCILCQETLDIDEDDLEETKESLRCHMDSKRHQFCLRNI